MTERIRLERADTWQKVAQEDWDLVVIGGGITGAGVAREAARRGIKTLLIEQRDYAWGTSSRSSKMVHGGLRYIAQGDIKLTWHSLAERERLLIEAPGLVTRMGYWFAHYRRAFPGRFVFGILLRFYDMLAGVRDRQFLKPKDFLERVPGYQGANLTGASRYTDALVDDSRLVMRVLDEACADGALALNYVKADSLIMESGRVSGINLHDEVTGSKAGIKAKAVINATGAWADRLREALAGERKVRPQRGSHVVLMPGRLPMAEAVIFMHPHDQRPLFIYPWEGRTVIGTTDLDHRDDLDVEATITSLEFDYILQGINAQFPHEKITRDDVVATFSGVRPIVASGVGVNPSAERRDHSVWDDAGLITVTGGKLTTFRLIALDALHAASRYFPGINAVDTKAAVFRPVGVIETKWPVSDLMRLKGRFGFYASQFLKESVPTEMKAIPQLETLWSELRWAARYEQVQHLDDLLLRRTRIGLLMPEGGSELLPQVRIVCQAELGWDDSRWSAEEERYRDIWHKYYGVPATASAHTVAA
ncbi:MAG: glycerol-3-phosphate dehydrogenase/oxidase [Moraxellaceae bacterium]|nr:glycerol-3-phosphate dehydrogenase/oxidase [Moraxellaceae bacterium]MBP9730886.1 glycerol-3-phosphate dehydrogenase/oxidase [Moraxellaceae bacterium]HQV41776.1 glycerol-3-phosphate dehydrogenase/oxidase [Moraxellaceae bacterium]HQX89367.1 glycerol-3-phosphate dehydrogenase/oxidase [Moraxellaceae bacterium]